MKLCIYDLIFKDLSPLVSTEPMGLELRAPDRVEELESI